MRLTILLVSTTLALAACGGKPPPNLGIREGKLSDCPNKPNCVSSQASSKEHYVEPINLEASVHDIQRALLSVVPEMEGARLVTAEPFYIRVEFTSKTMGFVDDVEFLIEPLSNIVHLRSASRLGYSDLGVNRKRVEDIRSRLSQALQPSTSS